MKCMSCLGLVVRLNSFRGFNLAHRRSTRASIRYSLRPLQRKATLLWIGTRAQVILAPLSLQFKVVSYIPHVMVNAPYVLLISLILLLGTTIHPCRSSGRHIVALECDADIFNDMLVPMQDPKPLPVRSTPRAWALIPDKPLQKK